MDPQIPSLATGHTSPSGSRDATETLLLLCAGGGADADAAGRAAALISRGIDWERFARLSGYHRVTPLVYSRLSAVAPGALPPALGDRFRKHFRAAAAQNLHLAQQFSLISRGLAARGVPVMGYKGLALAAQAYGNIVLREAGDLDLFVALADVETASQVLLDQGFHRHADYHNSDDYHRHFVRSRDEVVVELHWGFAPKHYPFAVDHRRLWRDRVPVDLGHGLREHTFAPVDAIPILCFHANKHHWQRLCWICDLDRLIRAQPDLDWNELMQQAKRAGVARVTRLGLLLAVGLLETPIPENVREWIRSDGVALRLAGQITAVITAGAAEGATTSLDCCVSIRERWQDRLPYLCRLLRLGLQVSDDERRTVPAFLRWRPVLLCARWLRRLAKPHSARST